jgi:putative ABC transport system permease protein
LKNKPITVINILGMTVGITISLLIFSYAKKESTTDQLIPNVSNIYSLMNKEDPHVSQQMVQLAKAQVPEIENITYCSEEWSPQVFFTNEIASFKVENLLVADSCFFRVLRFEPIWGDPYNALNLTNKIVLTENLSKKIFGNENPVGKMLGYNSTYLHGEEIEVAAVIKDLPQNSSWNFEAVLSIQTNYKIDWYFSNLGWGQQSFTSFFSIPESVSPKMLNEKLASLSKDNVPDKYKDDIEMSSFPFTKIYFGSPNHDILKHGNQLTLSIIEIVGILILLLACVNYINLVTAQREKRFKTIGTIKSFGCSKWKVIELLTIESALVLTLTFILVTFSASLLLDSLNGLTDSQFTFHSIFTRRNLGILFLIFVFTLIVTGLIPGYFYSKYKTALLFNKNQSKTKQANYLRNGLLIFQFTISIALIAGMLTIERQNRFMTNTNPGFNKNNIIFFSTNDDLQKNIQPFKNEMKKIPGITDLTFSEEPIGKIDQNWGMDIQVHGEKKTISFVKLSVSPNFFDFFGIKIKKGNGFNENSKENRDLIFNAVTMLKYNFVDQQGMRLPLSSDQNKGRVIGEVEDFNFESMHVPIRPIGFMSSGEGDEVAYLKLNTINTENFHSTIESIEKIWNKLSPNFPFEYEFLNDSWDALYKKENQFLKVLSYTTIISLFLSCLGLIGLTFYIIENRIKEIGIRKINGATISEVMTMLNRDFVKWVAIAFVIACPIAWYAMNKWLENFAYKTELSWWIFALAGLLALGIALLTVSWQSWRAATRNPVEALRYE